jgi:uncharacterized protein
MTETRVVSNTLEFPYSRTLGPTIGAFAAGLREQRLFAARTIGGRMLMPPVEYDPETSDATEPELIEVGPEGVVESWSWVPEPSGRQPFDRPFAFAMIRVDGTDTGMIHVLTAESPADISTGMRVRPVWKDERTGRIDDIQGWEKVAG